LTLHLLAGLPPAWLTTGQHVSIENTPTTLWTAVSLKVETVSANKLEMSFAPGNKTIGTVVVHLPLPEGATVRKVNVTGSRNEAGPQGSNTLVLHDVSQPTTIEIEFAQ
jgi:hypothetical protein